MYNDPSSLFYAAKGLMTLQSLYGIIPNIYGKGDCAKVMFYCTSVIKITPSYNTTLPVLNCLGFIFYIGPKNISVTA